MGKSESMFWKDAKEKPEHPKVVKLSTRCARVRVGDLRSYMQRIETSSANDAVPVMIPKSSKPVNGKVPNTENHDPLHANDDLRLQK